MATEKSDVKAGPMDKSAMVTQRSNSQQQEGSVKVTSVVLIAVVVATAFMATALAIVFVQQSVESLLQVTQPTIVLQPITSTVSALPSYEDLMVTQKTVLESTSRAVESTNRTADMMLTVNAFLFTVMTAAGVGALWKAGSASDEASKAAQRAAKSIELVQTTEQTVEELDTRLGDLGSRLASLTQEAEEAHKRLEEFVGEQERQRELAKRDMDFIKTSLALTQLDECGMGIRSGNPSRRWKAIGAALEMSTRDDDIIRRKAVKVLGSVEECDERIIERLEEMTVRDPARGVRQEAEEALEKLRRLCEEAMAE